jgi:hypothetical protein
MIYKRSSFINLLRTKYTCEIRPLRDRDVILITNGPAHKYMHLDALDRIDYEEIYSCYKQLCLEDLVSTSDLIPADPMPADKKKKRG